MFITHVKLNDPKQLTRLLSSVAIVSFYLPICIIRQQNLWNQPPLGRFALKSGSGETQLLQWLFLVTVLFSPNIKAATFSPLRTNARLMKWERGPLK